MNSAGHEVNQKRQFLGLLLVPDPHQVPGVTSPGVPVSVHDLGNISGPYQIPVGSREVEPGLLESVLVPSGYVSFHHALGLAESLV